MLGMVALENKLVYQPRTAEESWEEPPDARIQEVWIPASIDGCDRLHAWWLPKEGSSNALMICHGNGGNISSRGPSLGRFADELNCGILIFDYPGYGKTSGSPSESNCYESARAAYRWLIDEKKVDPTRIVIYGESLGGGVAVQLASEVDHRALVLMKTFTSLPAVGQKQYPWLPVKWLMCNRYDNLSKLPSCKRPVLIAGASMDEMVPFAHSEELFRIANEPKHFRALVGSEHNSSLPADFLPELRTFLKAHP